jgi:GR25 family glycosyltransferase involved in LPS biosynthesis
MCVVLGLIALLLVLGVTLHTNGNASTSACYSHIRATSIRTYYINKAEQSERRKMMEEQLSRLGLPFRRVSAIEPRSPEYRLLMLEQPCKRNTPTDISVILSHLKALYTAVHHPVLIPGRKSTPMDDYALILEDDVKILYDIDFHSLVRAAPRKFGILQLATSNPEAVDMLWYTLNTAHCCNTTVTYLDSNGANVLECAARLPHAESPPLQSACADYGTIEASIRPRLPSKKKKKQSADAWNQDDYVAPPAYTKYAATNPHRVHDAYAASYWKQNNWFDFSRNGRTSLYWSTQAYIVNRRTAWRMLNDIVQVLNTSTMANSTADTGGTVSDRSAASIAAGTTGDEDLKLGFKIVNSFSAGTCQRRPERPCVLGSCLFAHSYIYSAGQPTHASMLPLVVTARVGLNSTLHPDLFPEHKKAHAKGRAITAQLKGDKRALLPPYLSVPSAECRRPGVGSGNGPSSAHSRI